MNKLYLLVALGLSINVEGSSTDGYSTGDYYGDSVGVDSSSAGSNGWYAGDCLDPTSFSSTYGYSDFDCGSNCQSDYASHASPSGGSGSGSTTYDYGDCYDDDFDC